MDANNEKYCQLCGRSMHVSAPLCPSCGAKQPNVDASASDKDWLTTLLLCVFLGYLGMHRFYAGHTLTGLVQLFTGGGCGVWYIIDMIMIATRSFKDDKGNVITEK